MTFKSSCNLKIKLQFAGLAVGSALLLSAFFFYGNVLAIIVAVPLLLAAATVGWQLLHTVYTVGETLLEAKSGLSHVTLEYKSISLVTNQKDRPADGYVPFALSSPPLYIYYTQEGKTYRLELSPQDREGFIKAIGERCADGEPEI